MTRIFDFQPVVRPMRREDIPAVVRMIADLADHHGDVATTDAATLTRDVFGPLPWVHVLVAESDAGLIGYSVLHPLYRAHFGQRGLEMHHLYVAAEWRGLGIGRRLIDTALDYGRRNACSYVSVGAAADNTASQAFYRRHGFAEGSPVGPRFRCDL